MYQHKILLQIYQKIFHDHKKTIFGKSPELIVNFRSSAPNVGPFISY